MYSIIDVETTGKTNRITEICILKYNGNKIVDEFTSLVNPKTPIPVEITTLTGIDNDMVANAPTFDKIANKIIEITEDSVFVAHNVNFDYNVIVKEFKQIELDFRRKKLCTIRLSKKLIPKQKSYNLDNLCTALEIPIENRHRAKGDAEATAKLFELILKTPKAPEVLHDFLKVNSKETTLPPHLPKAVFNALPNQPGIYLFKNQKKEVIYVGKAINIKQRVLSHFYDKKQRELDMCLEITHIDFELSGSELIALLMEDEAIKKHYPKYNFASKRYLNQYAIFNYTDRKGIIHFAIQKIKTAPNPLIAFSSQREAIVYLENICHKFSLCPKLCHLSDSRKPCNFYKVNSCGGICKNKESKVVYNIRVKQAVEEIQQSQLNKIISQPGRTPKENAFIVIEKGNYKGYGFVKNDIQINNKDVLNPYLIPKKDNLDVQKILKRYIYA